MARKPVIEQIKMLCMSNKTEITETRAGVCKTLCPQHLLDPKLWPNLQCR